MKPKDARSLAIEKGHQPGMFRRHMERGKWFNYTTCQHGCGCRLYEGASGVWGTMLLKECRTHEQRESA